MALTKQASAARKALVSACLDEGIQDPKEIQRIAREVSRNCSRQQVAGIKAYRTGSLGWNHS